MKSLIYVFKVSSEGFESLELKALTAVQAAKEYTVRVSLPPWSYVKTTYSDGYFGVTNHFLLDEDFSVTTPLAVYGKPSLAVGARCTPGGAEPGAPLYFKEEGGVRVHYSGTEKGELIYDHEFSDMLALGEATAFSPRIESTTKRALCVPPEIDFLLTENPGNGTRVAPGVYLMERYRVQEARDVIARKVLKHVSHNWHPRTFDMALQGVLFAEAGTDVRKHLILAAIAARPSSATQVLNVYMTPEFPEVAEQMLTQLKGA